jgi:hypothetical protein
VTSVAADCQENMNRLIEASLRRLRRLGVRDHALHPPPALAAHPMEAVLAQRSGIMLPFVCPVGSIVMLNGMGFCEASWHPFTAVLKERKQAAGSTYEGSVLARFYAVWTPAQAAEAIVGFENAPRSFAALPSYGYHQSPWSFETTQATLDQLRNFYSADYEEHGCSDLRLERDGFKYHGPVSRALGVCEYQRLVKVYDSLAAGGYDRAHGEVNVYVLRRGTELRFICRGGVHRVAASSALDRANIPARLCPPFLVDAVEFNFWPAVLNGTWTPSQALEYFNHLFDFDAREWAVGMGLTGMSLEQPSTTSTDKQRTAPTA